ncbi:MAG: hypothetical protein KAT16_05445 [Candidatus Heimdallarchaeota archaeon]|nr:hypothetical protein [Candidatus Heimdallarchaeota archaeon]
MIIEKFKLLKKEFLIFLVVIPLFPILSLLVIQIVKIESTSKMSMYLVISGNVFPILLVILFLSYESGFIGNCNKSYFMIYENGIIRIHKYSIFLSIFESNSIHLVNSKGLYQLIDLDPFSLEIDCKTKRLRVYIFSKSKKNQLNRIKQSVPLLEAIFPDLLLMNPHESKKLLESYSIAEIAGLSLIQEKEGFLMPVIDFSFSDQLGIHNKLVLAFNSSRKDPNLLKDSQTTQVYTLPRYNGSIDFNLIGNIILRNTENFDFENFDKNLLLRAIIRFQLNNTNLISFEEGVSYIQKAISTFRVGSQSIVSEIKSNDDLIPINAEIEPEIPMIFINEEEINPICLELCNIYNNLEIDEKDRAILCEKRINFCGKLIRNNNFISLLIELTNKDDDKRKSQILSEILVHLSFHQLYCLIAQFIFTYKGKDFDVISIQLLHSLINKQAKSDLHLSRGELEIQKSIQKYQTIDCDTNIAI